MTGRKGGLDLPRISPGGHGREQVMLRVPPEGGIPVQRYRALGREGQTAVKGANHDHLRILVSFKFRQ